MQRPAYIENMVAYVNGEFRPAETASVTVFDRGLRWGDGVYDVERTFRHVPFRLHDHVLRTVRSLRHARITTSQSPQELEDIANELIEHNARAIAEDSDLEVVQIITRGTLWDSGGPTVVMYCRELDWQRLARLYRRGVPLLISSVRNIPAQCLPPSSKIANKMNQRLAEIEAKGTSPEAGGLMLDVHGIVAEGTNANLFFVSDGVLRTPSLQNCLPGISRMTTLELAGRLGIPCEEGRYWPFDLSNAEEAFLTSTSPCLYGVLSVNGLPFTSPFPGPLFRRLTEAWKERVGMDFVEQALRKVAAAS